MASMQLAEMYMLDLTSCIQFSSILLKKAQISMWKIGMDPIWMAWSDFGQTHLLWK